MTAGELRDLMRYLCRLDGEKREDVRGLAKARADIIIGGGAIAEELMFLFGIDRIEITPLGLREGLQADYHLSKGGMLSDVRKASVATLARRCGCDLGHASAVRDYSEQIFDGAAAIGLHGMRHEMRDLLSCAAFLHDIGEIVNYSDHHILSQMMIENSDMVGFDTSELRDMGLMARFHHKKFPGPKDRNLRGLPPKESLEVRQCSMFLRMADILDRHRTSSIGGITLENAGGSVMLRFACSEDPSMEIWRKEKIKGDFERLFGTGLILVPDYEPDGDGALRAADPQE
jgi:exopolyphosphatase/guanosine-5'-triphosphate,3'-diphosphate pyrophosphatase